MKIQVGLIRMNEITGQIVIKSENTIQKISTSKTTKYLVPCLKEYGEEFTRMLQAVYKIAAGIGDAILINRDIKHEKHVFILLDSAKPMHIHFSNFINWIKEQDYYVDDYVYGDIQKSTFHMVILKFPEKYYDSFQTFKIGKYSEMYKKDDIEKFFENHPESKDVLIKDHNYKIKFTAKVNKLFGTNMEAKDYEGELDFKPTDASEIFNHHLKR